MKPKTLFLIALISCSLAVGTAFAAQVNFTPRTSVGTVYTDNVDLVENNKDDDFITGFSAGGTLQVLGRTSGMELSFDPGYVWYANDTSDDTWRLPASLNLWKVYARHTRLEFFDSFLRTEDPLSDTGATSAEGDVSVPGDTTVRRGRNPYYTNTAVARVTHQFGQENSVYGEFLWSLLRNDNDFYEDNDEYSPRAGLTYWFTNKWGTEVNGIYTRGDFEDSSDYDDIAGDITLRRRFTPHFDVFGRYAQANRYNDGDVADYIIYAPSAGFRYQIAQDLNFEFGVGYYYQAIDGEEDEESPFVEGLLSKLWDYNRWTIGLEGSAGLDRNDFGAERLGFEQYGQVEGTGTYAFTRRLSGNALLRYRYSDYVNENRNDSRFQGGVGLAYNPLLWMSLALNYEYNDFSTTGDDEDYQENRAIFLITLQPDQPWRF